MAPGTRHVETLVIGAGQAGLSAGYHLARRGLPFAIVDADARVGDHWRERWESLRLYSPAGSDSLPGMRFPTGRFRHPTGREMGDYLETYAARFALPVVSGTRVNGLEPVAGGFVATLEGGGRVAAAQVIVATGAFQTPWTPPFAADLDPSIRQLHSHAYRSPDQVADGPVLVVGLSHSGADIAHEVARSHRTILSGTAASQLPFSVDSLRGRIAWPLMAFAFAHVLTIRTPMGRRMRPLVRNGGGPLLRVRTPDLDAAGVERHDAKTVGVRHGKPLLADGALADVATVIWCTGYKRDYGWIGAPVMAPDGYPDEVRGVSQTVPGLYFLGVPFSYAFTSMLVAGADRDAKYVVDRIAERVQDGTEARNPAPASVARQNR